MTAIRVLDKTVVGTSKNLLRVAALACDARCTFRTAAFLDQICGRSRRFFEVPEV
jgi:hypothetical protein